MKLSYTSKQYCAAGTNPFGVVIYNECHPKIEFEVASITVGAFVLCVWRVWCVEGGASTVNIIIVVFSFSSVEFFSHYSHITGIHARHILLFERNMDVL